MGLFDFLGGGQSDIAQNTSHPINMGNGINTQNFGYASSPTGAADAVAKMQQQSAAYQARNAPQAGYSQINQKQSNYDDNMAWDAQMQQQRALGGMQGAQNSAQSQAMLQMLQNSAQGNGPSQAQGILQQGIAGNINQAQALAASARGGGNARAMAQFEAGQQAGAATQAGAGQAANLRAQEMQNAQGLYSNAVQGVRGQDLNAQQQYANAIGSMRGQDLQSRDLSQQQALQQAQLNQGVNLANLGAQGQTLGMNDDMVKAYMNGQFQVNNAQLGAGMNYAGMANQDALQQQQIQAQINAQNTGIAAGANTANAANAGDWGKTLVKAYTGAGAAVGAAAAGG